LEKIKNVRQEVTVENKNKNKPLNGIPCRDVLRKGGQYRVSGKCKGDTFFADPCGIVERSTRKADAV
jgi:phage FluMu gp28-like protein